MGREGEEGRKGESGPLVAHVGSILKTQTLPLEGWAGPGRNDHHRLLPSLLCLEELFSIVFYNNHRCSGKYERALVHSK